jgi:hypothetical protein
LAKEESISRLKSRAIWISEGDNNTKRFTILPIIEKIKIPFGRWSNRMVEWIKPLRRIQ